MQIQIYLLKPDQTQILHHFLNKNKCKSTATPLHQTLWLSQSLVSLHVPKFSENLPYTAITLHTR